MPFNSEAQRKYVMARYNRPKIAMIKKVNGTVINFQEEGDLYVSKYPGKQGNLLKRFMNEEEAKRWHKETGHPIEKV